MNDPASVRRQLKIKTGVVKRLLKENQLYAKEVADLNRKVDQFIADGAEDWDVKNGRKMMEESQKMVADTSQRLGPAVAGLHDLVAAVQNDPLLEYDEALLTAKGALAEANV